MSELPPCPTAQSSLVGAAAAQGTSLEEFGQVWPLASFTEVYWLQLSFLAHQLCAGLSASHPARHSTELFSFPCDTLWAAERRAQCPR